MGRRRAHIHQSQSTGAALVAGGHLTRHGLSRAMKGEKDGIKDIERATQMDPASATAQLYLGMALAQSKEKKPRQRAEQALQKALELNAKSGEFAPRLAE